MYKSLKKLSVLLLTLFIATAIVVPVSAKKSPKINKKSISVYVGKSYKLKVTGTKKKIKWKTSNKKVATVSKKGTVTGKKKGTATITATVAKKKLKCKVTVKNVDWTKGLVVKNYKGKNKQDVLAINEIVKAQKAKGAEISADLNDLYHENNDDEPGGTYLWSKDGRLTMLYICFRDLKSSISFSKLTKLETIDCMGNALTSIDVSKCTNLKTLKCGYNKLTKVDVSKCTKLQELIASRNRLETVKLGKNKALEDLICDENKLTSLDVSNCNKLNTIFCEDNKLTSLKIKNFSKLYYLDCSNNQLTNLDLTGCTALVNITCNSNNIKKLDLTSCPKIEYILADDYCNIIYPDGYKEPTADE